MTQSRLRRLTLTLFCLISIASFSAASQKFHRLRDRYKVHTVFEVRPGIEARATFNKNSEVCRLVIEKRQFRSSKLIDFDVTIPSALVKEIVDEVAPPNERGRELRPVFNESFVGGGTSFLELQYEKITISMYGTVTPEAEGGRARVIIIDWLNENCPSEASQ